MSQEGIKKTEMDKKVRGELRVGGQYVVQTQRLKKCKNNKRKKYIIQKRVICTSIYPNFAYFKDEKGKMVSMIYADIYNMLNGKVVDDRE